MGFLSKLFKKAKPFLPIALAMFGPGLLAGAGSATGLGSLFSGMNPMAANMLKQSALGYGTAALSGSKRPEKAAMYAGLASIPFSYMSASQAANAYNQKFAGEQGVQRFMESPGKEAFTSSVPGAAGMTRYHKAISPTWGFQDIPGKGAAKITPWDILSGKYKEGVPTPSYLARTDEADPKGLLYQDPSGYTGEDVFVKKMAGKPYSVDADIFSKTSAGGTGFSGRALPAAGTVTPDWIPTMASQTAAMYGGSDTDEEKWEAAQKRRKKELAWMYGVPEDMIEGEMTNPWSTGGGFWNKGGIASLENGGDVSGPGSGTSDSINANLSDGEFVMTAKAVENLGNGDRYAGARQMYNLMNVLDPESESMSEVV